MVLYPNFAEGGRKKTQKLQDMYKVTQASEDRTVIGLLDLPPQSKSFSKYITFTLDAQQALFPLAQRLKKLPEASISACLF